MATYQFDTDYAQEYGVNEAIMLANLIFWIRTNKAEGRHQHDGRTWTYNTNEGLCKLFPFWSPNQVRYALDSLIKQKVILSGDYSPDRFKRPRWFALENEDMLGLPGLKEPAEKPAEEPQHAPGKNPERVVKFPNTGGEISQGESAESTGDIISSDSNRSDVKHSDSETLNVGRTRSKASPWSRRGTALADQAIRLTGDEKSRRRYQQLAGIVLDAGGEDLWNAAFKATEARLKKASRPLDAPGAYFCKTLTQLLGNAGVYIPVGTQDERDDVKAQIAASLGQGAAPQENHP